MSHSPRNNPVFDLVARLFVASTMFLYGIGKLLGWQFGPNPGIKQKILDDLTGFELTWYFFSKSFGYTAVIAATQLIGGLLLLDRKTRIAGALILLPILFNIICIDLFYGIPHGALGLAIVILLCVLYILYQHKEALIQLLLNQSNSSTRPEISRQNIMLFIIYAILLFVAVNITTLLTKLLLT